MDAFKPLLPSSKEYASPALELRHSIVSAMSKLTPYLLVGSETASESSQLEALNSPEAVSSLDELKSLTTQLQHQINGTSGYWRELVGHHYELAAISVVERFNIAAIVPVSDSISAAEISRAIHLDEDKLLRILRLLVTIGIFKECSKGRFGHTVLSLDLREGPIRGMVGFQFDEMNKASVELDRFLKENPYSNNGTETPFKMRWNMSLFEFYAKDAERAARFAAGMNGFTKVDRGFIELENVFKARGFRRGKVVDVGGGSGHVSFSLAESFPDALFIVQDINERMWDPSTFSNGTELEKTNRGKVNFMKHDFFTPQPVKDADYIFIRQCLHNWSDEDCRLILNSLLPAMHSNESILPGGAHLIINETIFPEPGELDTHQERLIRQVDLAMMVSLNTKQRTEFQWRELLNSLEEEVEIVQVVRPEKGNMGILEVKLM